MKNFKDPNNNDQTHVIEEGFEHLLPNGCVEIDQAEFDLLTTPVSLTAQEIDDEKDAQALAAASSPALESAIEEFSAILIAAGIDVPADIKANITARIKGKLP